MTTWQRLLDDYESLLDEVERRLDADDWDGSLPALTAPAPPILVPTPAEQARLTALLGRGEVCRRRLDEELGETREGIEQLGRRRDAAALYAAG